MFKSMKLEIDGVVYPIVIEKKKTTKNTYIRVKEDLTIYVTTNILTRNSSINKIIDENYKAICKMIEKQEIKNNNNSDFHFLGNRYDIIYTEYCDISFGENKVFLNKNIDVDKWYKKQAKIIFKKHLDEIYKTFSREIVYPELRIRKMTTRWGVCNTKTKVITLNLELIKRDEKYLDYVIVHELSHLIHPNHSSKFWELVEENFPKYKQIKKEMKEF